jgi:DNA-binding response OmpR family regulator
MLLDRQADVHLAKRCAADAYLVKPLNPLSLKRAARAILASAIVPEEPDEPDEPTAWETAEEVPATAG